MLQVTWDKGRASLYILRTAFGVDWAERIRIVYAGDDITDEDAILALKGLAYTFRIVNSHFTKTMADRRLPSTDSVLTLLKWVERHMADRYTQLISLLVCQIPKLSPFWYLKYVMWHTNLVISSHPNNKEETTVPGHCF